MAKNVQLKSHWGLRTVLAASQPCYESRSSYSKLQTLQGIISSMFATYETSLELSHDILSYHLSLIHFPRSQKRVVVGRHLVAESAPLENGTASGRVSTRRG